LRDYLFAATPHVSAVWKYSGILPLLYKELHNIHFQDFLPIKKGIDFGGHHVGQ
jgi:hypothetical protein